MTTASETRRPDAARTAPGRTFPDAVTASVGYIARPASKPYRHTAAYTGGAAKLFADDDTRPVTIANARRFADRLSLDREGVALRNHVSAVTDFDDDGQIERIYAAEIEQLLKEMTGASRVVLFDHTRRTDAGGGKAGIRETARQVHNDYTDWSGRDRVAAVLGEDDLERLGSRRIAQVNVWRPTRGPVQRSPLGAIDASSLAPGDLIATDQIYPDRVGEIHHVAWNPAHRWLYFPGMTPEEVMLIKGWDSATDGRARFTPHAAFDDPTTPADAPPRESIETRALLVF